MPKMLKKQLEKVEKDISKEFKWPQFKTKEEMLSAIGDWSLAKRRAYLEHIKRMRVIEGEK